MGCGLDYHRDRMGLVVGCDGHHWDRGQDNNLDSDLADLDSLGLDGLDLGSLGSGSLDLDVVGLDSLGWDDLGLDSLDLRQGTVQMEHLDHSEHLVHSGRLVLVVVVDIHYRRLRCYRYLMVAVQMVFV